MTRREHPRIDPRGRKVKIRATSGPASRSPEMLDRLVRAGADAFRLNMSHGAHADLGEDVDALGGGAARGAERAGRVGLGHCFLGERGRAGGAASGSAPTGVGAMGADSGLMLMGNFRP